MSRFLLYPICCVLCVVSLNYVAIPVLPHSLCSRATTYVHYTHTHTHTHTHREANLLAQQLSSSQPLTKNQRRRYIYLCIYFFIFIFVQQQASSQPLTKNQRRRYVYLSHSILPSRPLVHATPHHKLGGKKVLLPLRQ